MKRVILKEFRERKYDKTVASRTRPMITYRCTRCNQEYTEINKKVGGYTEFFISKINKPDEAFIEEILCLKESNSGELLKFKTILSEACNKIQERATTILQGSTLQANGSGKGSNLNE